jgi:drug/metabolite transporter superfamily protein YnfA
MQVSSSQPAPVEVDAAHGIAVLGGEPHVFHCHHYNCFLQKAVADNASFLPVTELLTRPGAEVAYAELRALGANRGGAEEVFRTLGFGLVDLSALTAAGGTVTVQGSHYGRSWLSRFGKSPTPVCFMPAGWIEGAARHLLGAAFTSVEVECVASGGKACRFEVKPGGPLTLPASPGVGALATFGPRPEKASQTSVNEAAIIAACGGLPLGGNAEGAIEIFGVSLTRHYANYYNLLSFRFDQAMAQALGEAATLASRLLLVEAGRVCAFHTFGGIMESAEWQALIEPQCKTREDWVYGMVSVINALGWGRWSVADLVPGERLEVVVDGSYESNGYLAAFGTSDVPRCYLATGGVAGLMNLLYTADVTKRPDLSPAFYAETFEKPGYFVGEEIACRAQGAPACRFVASKLG